MRLPDWLKLSNSHRLDGGSENSEKGVGDELQAHGSDQDQDNRYACLRRMCKICSWSQTALANTCGSGDAIDLPTGRALIFATISSGLPIIGQTVSR